MTKSLCLTTPVVGENDAAIVTPTSEWMHLEGTHPDLIYGFHGSTTSKQPFLSSAYDAADKKGVLTKRKLTFYLVDLTYRAPEPSDSQSLLYGQLPSNLLEKTPFIVSRRLSAEAAQDLGELWMEIARDQVGVRKINDADVNWAQPASYMLAFPQVAPEIFRRMPLLRCLLMPMRMKTMPAGSDICLVGVAPKSNTKGVLADVRFKPDVKVDLAFA